MQNTVDPRGGRKVYFCDICCVTRGLWSSMSVWSLHVESLDRRWKVVPRVQRCNNNNKCIGEKIDNKKLKFCLACLQAHACMQPFYFRGVPLDAMLCDLKISTSCPAVSCSSTQPFPHVMSSKASQTSALGAQNQNANFSTKRHPRAPLPRLKHQSPYLYRKCIYT